MNDCQGNERGDGQRLKAFTEKNERVSEVEKRRAAPRKRREKGKKVVEEKRRERGGGRQFTWGMGESA